MQSAMSVGSVYWTSLSKFSRVKTKTSTHSHLMKEKFGTCSHNGKKASSQLEIIWGCQNGDERLCAMPGPILTAPAPYPVSILPPPLPPAQQPNPAPRSTSLNQDYLEARSTSVHSGTQIQGTSQAWTTSRQNSKPNLDPDHQSSPNQHQYLGGKPNAPRRKGTARSSPDLNSIILELRVVDVGEDIFQECPRSQRTHKPSLHQQH